jgi:hypothetical protein
VPAWMAMRKVPGSLGVTLSAGDVQVVGVYTLYVKV